MPDRCAESAAGQHPLTRGQQIRCQIKHTLENWFFKTCFPGLLIKKKYSAFQRLRHGDRSALELISGLEEIRQKSLVCDLEYIRHQSGLLDKEVRTLVESLIAFNPLKYALLRNYHRKYAFYADLCLMEDDPETGPPYVLGLDPELSEDLAGGKAAELSFLLGNNDFSVPPGLVITTRAFNLFLKKNRLLPVIRQQLSRLGPDSHDTIHNVSRIIQNRLMEAQTPNELKEQVTAGLHQKGLENTELALRSSAVGEDLQASFAGQFESRLGVSPDGIFQAYKEVAASKYSPHALYYRMSRGFTDSMTPMAVLIMPFIRAKTSGILYTAEHNSPDRASVHMVSGSGEKLAAGAKYQAASRFDKKRRELVQDSHDCPLEPDTLTTVFEIGEKLEELFGVPQDVEWIADGKDRIYILQSRPLRMSEPEKPCHQEDYPESSVLARGQWVSTGRASGKVHKLKDIKSISQIPQNAVLVTDELPPALTLALGRVAAVVAEKGSPACHFASVARESKTTAICSAPGAMSLQDNQIVSIDGDSGLVLDGALFDTRTGPPEPDQPDSPVMKKLSEALRFISPLSLQDPEADDFSIRSCKSLHDIVRYVHEAGVGEMFSLVGRRGLDSYMSKRLDSGIPLVMHVLDVHSGLISSGKSIKTVKMEHVKSRPMRQLFAGLASPAVQWDSSVLHYDWDAYSKSSASFVDVEKSTLFSSYAILDREYLHALLRFGYHFAVLDTVACPRPEHNYIHFSFKGGGGNQQQKFLRIELINLILEHFGFSVRTTADFLEAFFDRKSMEDTGVNLSRLGIVLGKTVLLDMRLETPQQVGSLAEEITEEVNGFFPV